MLEQARKKGASIFIYLIFCLLIAIFVINFGPQGGGGGNGQGCTGSSNPIISIDGEEQSQTAWHIAYSNPYNRGQAKEHTYWALEMLIRRELLAQAATERGLRATDDMIDDQIKKGRFFIGGQRAQIPGAVEEIDGESFYNHKAVRGWVQQLNVSLGSYREDQKRGLLASMMADILTDSVQVSRDEALQRYLFENNTVQYDVVAFRPDAYRAAMKLTDADVERFISTHGAEVEARYKADERTYKGVKPQLQLRQIFIAKLEDKKAEPAPTPAPDQGSAAGSAAPAAGDAKKAAPKKDEKVAAKKTDEKTDAKKPAGMPIDAAKTKLEAVRSAVSGGTQKFADAAKKLNTDEAMKNSGGDLGWRTADNAMLGDKAVTDAVKTLEPGEMTPVITTDKGAYLVMAEAKREGDLTYDQVKHEIARALALDVWSKEAAKRAAISALDNARSGLGLNLDQMYEQEQVPSGPGVDIQKILNDPNMSQEQKQQLLEMLMKNQPQSGQIVWESNDQPAAWYAQADGAGSAKTATPASAAKTAPAAGATAPAAGSAKAATPAAGATKTPTAAPAAGSAKAATPAAGATKTPEAAPAAGSAAPAAGSAAPAAGSAAGAGAGSAATTPTEPAAPAATEIKASDDKLPAFGEVEKATVARFGPAPRSATMSGIGASKEAQRALFEELTPGMLAKQVYEGDGAFLLVQLISRTEPEIADFDKDADRLVAELRQSRAQAFLLDWMKDRCLTLAKENKIQPNPELLRENDEQGRPMPIGYRPCMSF